MGSDPRLTPEEEHALNWLQRSLEWEEILAALRGAGGRKSIPPGRPEQEPAEA